MGSGSKLNSCGEFMKYTMFVFNVISLLVGIGLVAVGVWTVVDKYYIERLTGLTLWVTGAYILIAGGCVVVILSLFACLGAIREIKSLLVTYFVLLLLIFMAILCGGVFAWIYRGTLDLELRSKFRQTMMNDYDQEYKQKTTDAWDYMQKTLHCCAVDKTTNYTWWRNSLWGQEYPGKRSPDSCCIRGREAQCRNNNLLPASKYLFTKGCYDRAYEVMRSHLAIIGSVGIAVAVLLVIGMIFAVCLVRQID